MARNAQQKSGGGEDGEEGGDAEAKRKAQRDRWERAVALFVEFSQAEERSSLELGEQIVRSLLHGEPELLPAATMVTTLTLTLPRTLALTRTLARTLLLPLTLTLTRW